MPRMGVCLCKGQLLLDAREMFKILRYMRKHWAGICRENKNLLGSVPHCPCFRCLVSSDVWGEHVYIRQMPPAKQLFVVSVK